MTVNVLSTLLTLTNSKVITTQKGAINNPIFHIRLNTLSKFIQLIKENSNHTTDSGVHGPNHNTLMHTCSHTNSI